jgi:hypothetical protein
LAHRPGPVLALPGTHLHLYGKAKASKGRKMGHLTVTGATVGQVRSTALQAAAILGIAHFERAVAAHDTPDPAESAPESIAICADAIRAGGLLVCQPRPCTAWVLMPTTMRRSQDFFRKGPPCRPSADRPCGLQDGGMSGVAHFAARVPPFAQQLMSAFWPGPLTLILPRRAGVGAACGRSPVNRVALPSPSGGPGPVACIARRSA